ncbi:MAG: TonB family protein [Methylobacter sp.]|uniref:energy transducer TonB n=1 Tax=Methylobacter sp. TaxID=2051955 RepID=UPI002730D253|nr:energy transducer TonB [Methylobacter sp.]MDP1664361.1 TonB family protein [Methylobacter sp.]
MFLFNSHEGGLADRNLKPSGDEASPLVQKKRSLFAALTGEEHPRFMGGLLLTLVLLLHIWAGLWLLTPTEKPKTPSLMVMEVSLVSTPSQKAEITPPAPPKPVPPKPEPPKKQPVKQPVKKKMPVIPKHAELPKPQAIAEEKSAPSNSAPTPSVSAPQSVSRPAPAVVSSEPRISTGVIPLERIPPKYPARAANRHIEGWVKIEFTITRSGTVENAVVVEAEPAEIFDEAALKAINQWTFKEKIVNGVAVEQRAVQTLQFKLTR